MKIANILIIITFKTIFSVTLLSQTKNSIDSLNMITDFKLSTERWKDAYSSKNA
jgi:hypothetical protein